MVLTTQQIPTCTMVWDRKKVVGVLEWAQHVKASCRGTSKKHVLYSRDHCSCWRWTSWVPPDGWGVAGCLLLIWLSVYVMIWFVSHDIKGGDMIKLFKNLQNVSKKYEIFKPVTSKLMDWVNLRKGVLMCVKCCKIKPNLRGIVLMG